MRDDLVFYQSMDLPIDGHVRGQWDHRRKSARDVYLARTDFTGRSVLDVGPANGFWSFEMERRGARSVTALELGPDDEWDIVPIGGVADRSAADGKRRSIAGTLRALEYTKEQLGSKVEVVRGTVYDAPKVVGPVNIALMGNILQHLRDPFLAIERVASLVTERIIIAETLWVDEDWFLKSASLRLIPRKETPDVDHSWYQVSPPWVGEILKLLGFTDLRCEYHDQQFNGNWIDNRPRKVRHFTYTARR